MEIIDRKEQVLRSKDHSLVQSALAASSHRGGHMGARRQDVTKYPTLFDGSGKNFKDKVSCKEGRM